MVEELIRIHDRLDRIDGRVRRVEIFGAFLIGLGVFNLGIPLLMILAG